MNAAATFVAKTAYASRQVQNVEFTSALPVGNERSLIAFGSYVSLPSELASRMNLDFVNIRTSQVKASPYEVASLDPIAMDLAPGTDRPASLVDVATSFSDNANAFIASPVDEAAAYLEGARLGVAAQMSKLNLKYLPALLGENQSRVFSPNALASVVVAQQTMSEGSVWTVIATRNASAIAAQTEVLTDRNVWNKLNGAIQSFSETGQVLDQEFSKDERLFQTQPLSIANTRLVVAGWLANNAEIYVGALLLAALVLGLGTFMVLVTGRRGHHG